MAKKSSRARQKDPAERLREAAFAFAAEGRWRDLSLSEIAERAGLSIAETYAIYPSKRALMRGFSRAIDVKVQSETDPDLGREPARDRLFDVMMRRFDAMQPHKDALAAILQDTLSDPLAAACSLPALANSMAAMLETAGLGSDGLRGRVRIKGLVLIYLATLRTWFRDDSEDLSKTMARLDANLSKADSILARCRCERPAVGAEV